MKRNCKSHLLKVGDYVITDYQRGCESVMRRITAIEKVGKKETASGYRVSADAGEKCPTCGRFFATAIQGVDAGWFSKITKIAG